MTLYRFIDFAYITPRQVNARSGSTSTQATQKAISQSNQQSTGKPGDNVVGQAFKELLQGQKNLNERLDSLSNSISQIPRGQSMMGAMPMGYPMMSPYGYPMMPYPMQQGASWGDQQDNGIGPITNKGIIGSAIEALHKNIRKKGVDMVNGWFNPKDKTSQGSSDQSTTTKQNNNTQNIQQTGQNNNQNQNQNNNQPTNQNQNQSNNQNPKPQPQNTDPLQNKERAIQNQIQQHINNIRDIQERIENINSGTGEFAGLDQQKKQENIDKWTIQKRAAEDKLAKARQALANIKQNQSRTDSNLSYVQSYTDLMNFCRKCREEIRHDTRRKR